LITGLLIGGVAVLLFAVLVYPGELTLFGPRANRWLYNRSAVNYQAKWNTPAYQDKAIIERILGHVQESISSSGVNAVLDLGCGTGRGIRLSGGALPPNTVYTGIDFSSEMLEQFRDWLSNEGSAVAPQVQLVEAELGKWASQDDHPNYGLVFMLEVAEFLPSFVAVLERLSSLVPPGGGLVMTRPAKLWWLFFPRRHQSRRALSRLLVAGGFEKTQFIPWRGRYELVLARKKQ
jgi:SAM-dependent methyltransferase